MPRQMYLQDLVRFSQHELIFNLYKKFQNDFIKYIKGNFIILIVFGNNFLIVNDRLGVRKPFYYIDNEGFIISNNMKLIADQINTVIDYNNVAISSLMNHYVEGMTFIKKIFFFKPATKIIYNEKLRFETYWDCSSLLNNKLQDFSYEEFAYKFKELIKGYIDFFKPKRVTVTLTGGLDSRTILSALLNLNVKPFAFSYGHPNSADVLIARKVASFCGLEYRNHYIDNINADWFYKIVKNIVINGNSIIQPHRAHRLDAFKEITKEVPDIEIVFGGYMGGEFIRGIYFDDLVVSEFVRRLWSNEKNEKKDLINEILTNNFIKIENVDLQIIIEKIKTFRYFSRDINKNHFYFLLLVEAFIHHSQDLNLLSNLVKYPIAIYMDIDFLNLLFSTKFNFFNTKKYCWNVLKKVSVQEFNCRLISILAPEIVDLPFAKKGYYSTKEYLDNRFLLIAKRGVRFVFGKKYPANFPIGEWMKEFVFNQIKVIERNSIINHIFDINRFKNEFKKYHNQNSEKYWKKYTDVIILYLLTERYLKDN
ncbi:MAG: hypothetical protein ACTSRG_21120 [Candidatus Helarchaeota archaeon]